MDQLVVIFVIAIVVFAIFWAITSGASGSSVAVNDRKPFVISVDEKNNDNEIAGKEAPNFLPAIIAIIVIIIFCAIFFGPAIVITAIMNTTSNPKSYDLSKQVPSWETQGATTPVSECALPILDGGDGLDTTGCGNLKVGVFVTGTTSSTLEAHNWQFSAQKGNSITIANNGKTCVKISILDSNGSVIEKKSFTCQDRTDTTISFTNFYPPTNGKYILRLTTPETPGVYWLKIR